MTYNFKKMLVGIFVIFTLIPGFTFAEINLSLDTKQDTATTDKVAEVKEGDSSKEEAIDPNGDFCVGIDEYSTKITDKIKEAETKQLENQENLDKDISSKEDDADAKRAISRTEADTKRTLNWTKMSEKAKTDTEKEAVQAYQVSVQQAITSRRSDVDAAVKEHRDGLTKILKDHYDAIYKAIGIFEESINTDLGIAKIDCESKLIESEKIKNTLDEQISVAQKVLQEAQDKADMTKSLELIKGTRDKVIEVVEATYKTNTDKARDDLILALKNQ